MIAKYRRRAGVITVAIAAWLLAGCAGNPPGDSSPGPVADSADQDSADQLPGPVGPDDPGAGEPAAPGWLPIGPAAPNDPAPDSWYSRLQNKDCAGLANLNADGSALWTAAITLCAAVVNQNADDWATGAEQLAAVPRPGASDCLEHATYETLSALVAFRQANPGVHINPASPRTTACPPGVTGLSTQGDFVADTGSVCTSGGASIRLLGRLVAVTEVTVGSHRVPADLQAENTVFFAAPAVDAPGSVTVTARTIAGTVPGSATLEYTSDSGQAVDGPCSTVDTGTDPPVDTDPTSNPDPDPPVGTNSDVPADSSSDGTGQAG